MLMSTHDVFAVSISERSSARLSNYIDDHATLDPNGRAMSPARVQANHVSERMSQGPGRNDLKQSRSVDRQVIDIESSSPEPPSKRARSAKTFIDLDSLSPEVAPNRAISSEPQAAERDSRYSVRNRKKRGRPESISYVVPDTTESDLEEGEISTDDSGSNDKAINDSDTSKFSQASAVSEDSHSLKERNKRTPGHYANRDRSGPRSEARSPIIRDTSEASGRRTKGIIQSRRSSGTSSDMQLGDSSASSSQSLHKMRKRNAEDSKNRSKLAAQKRKDYWSSKGPPNSCSIDSEDDEEVIWVKAK